MVSNPTISVILICYNHERYIDEAIKSILAQTYTDFELIIVDDGSTDNSPNIIREYKDPRITIVEQANSGPSIALNTGISNSRGQFIAFMSSDDVSLPDRLMTQIKQIELQNADVIFCLPQIIGPDSNILGDDICPWFFHRDFNSTAELYRQLFHVGNFLCAPSCFCRRSAIEKVGLFKRGLIQLQDFDYWIRACKKMLVIKLHKDPLLRYRYLFGANLSDRSNMNRALVETSVIYRTFLDEAPIDLLRNSFGEKITLDAIESCLDIEIDKSFLLFEHSQPTIKAIGIERLIVQLEDNDIYKYLTEEKAFGTSRFFQLTKAISLDVNKPVDQLKNQFVAIRNLLLRYLGFLITEGPRWTDAQVKARIIYYLEKGDHKRAIMVAHGYQRFPPGPTLFASLFRLVNKVSIKSYALFVKVIKSVLAGIRSFKVSIINTRDYITTVTFPPPVMERVLSVIRMYDYSKRAGCLVFEKAQETFRLDRPKVHGNFTGILCEGEVISPRPYVSIVNHAIITGGSGLVISDTGELLSDEMVDFPTEDFGIKSPYIRFRHKNDVILAYRRKPNTYIKEGILLSCDHDNNYFHWLIECLPKLVLIDDLSRFRDAPLLIPNGLHRNLIAALERVNIYNHPIILLEQGVAYEVKRLIAPSALSTLVDRYRGQAVFDTDIVLSQTWVPRVGELLRKNILSKRKPWRRLYLARRKGLRALGNQEDIERMLSEHNFEIVELDNVSLDYQIDLFSQASVIVAPTGAALTNMLLCQPGTKVIIFMSNHESSPFYLWSQLGDIAGLDVKIIVGERLYNLANYYSVHDDYIIDTSILLDEIRK